MELILYEKLMKGWVYKMKNKLALVFGILFVIGLTLSGCDDSTTSDDNEGGGILILNNGPPVISAEVHDYNGPVTTLEDFTNGIMATTLAVSPAGVSPHVLLDNSTGNPFTRTGTFLVIVTTNAVMYFKSGVNFNNGSATIDFNNMTPHTDL
jgi:hypothetical protein